MSIQFKIPTISAASAYTSGDVIGGAIELGAGNGGLLTDIMVRDYDGEGVQLDFFFFAGSLSGTYTDNAAFAIDDADECIGVKTLFIGDYLAAGADKVATLSPINIQVSSGIFSFVMVIRSATTFTAIDDLRLKVGILGG